MISGLGRFLGLIPELGRFLGLIPQLGRSLLQGRRSPGEVLPTPVLWPEEFHRLYSLWGHKESDTTECLSLTTKIRMIPAFKITFVFTFTEAIYFFIWFVLLSSSFSFQPESPVCMFLLTESSGNNVCQL